MTDPLEQRLREALEAYAETVSPDTLDPAKEEAFREAISPRNAWRAILLGGAAAAAVVVGAVSALQLTDDGGRRPVADSDPTISATMRVDESATRSASRPPPSSQSPLPPTTGTTTATPTPTSGGRATSGPPTSAPRPTTTPSVPVPGPTPNPDPGPDRPTTGPPPPAIEPTAPATTTPPPPRPSGTEPSVDPTPPTPTATSTPSAPRTSLEVSVRATPLLGLGMAWNATASGRVQADVPRMGLLGYRVSYGDGRSADAPLPGTCEPVAPVLPVTLPISPAPSVHVYTRPGTYRVTVAVTYCANAGVERTATDSTAVTVK